MSDRTDMKSNYLSVFACGVIVGTVFSRGFITSGMLLIGAAACFFCAAAMRSRT